MSAVAFGLTRRAKGRHVPLATDETPEPEIVQPWGVYAQMSGAERASAAYDSLHELVASAEAGDVDSITLQFTQTVLVLCGDCGRGEAQSGRCPKCAGTAMTLQEVALHKARVIAGRRDG